MSRIFRGIALACYLSIALLASGCGEDNEKSAAIKGTPPTDNKTEKEQLDAMRNSGAGGTMKGAGYPGAAKK
jgi:hypothetical protein